MNSSPPLAKRSVRLKLLFAGIWLAVFSQLSGCNSTSTNSNFIETREPVNTSTPQESVSSTLTPNQAKDAVSELLMSNEGCENEVPCFWGITPGETTLEELELMARSMGRPLILIDNYSSISFASNEGVEISTTFSISNDIVENGEVLINLQDVYGKIPSKHWKAFSIEQVLKGYGAPDSIDLHIEFPHEPTSMTDLVLYDLYIKFSSSRLMFVYANGFGNLTEDGVEICPLIEGDNAFSTISMFIGEHFEIAESSFVPLEDTSTISTEQFRNLMVGSSQSPCIHLDLGAFGY